MAQREVYLVSVTRPDGVTIGEMKAYIRQAVHSWCRGGSPEAPMWKVGDKPVSVRQRRRGVVQP